MNTHSNACSCARAMMMWPVAGHGYVGPSGKAVAVLARGPNRWPAPARAVVAVLARIRLWWVLVATSGAVLTVVVVNFMSGFCQVFRT